MDGGEAAKIANAGDRILHTHNVKSTRASG